MPLLSKLQQQVIHKMGKLPYEIYKCYDDPFRNAKEFTEVKWDRRFENLNRREETLAVEMTWVLFIWRMCLDRKGPEIMAAC